MLNKTENNRQLMKIVTFIWLFILFAFVISVRTWLLEVPLERDEGEYAYMGQLLLKGFAPFTHAYNMKFPGVSFVLAPFILIFGSGPVSIHLALLVVNLITLSYTYLLVRKLLGDVEALIAITITGLLSISQYYLGFAAHATHFVLAFALPGLYYLYNAIEKKSNLLWVASGVLLGLSFTMKQSAVFFLVFAAIITYRTVYKKETSIFQAGIFSLGMAIPFLLLVLIVTAAGNFDKFWFWTYTYLSEYGSKVSLEKGLDYFVREVKAQFTDFPLLIGIFFTGIIVSFFTSLSISKKLLFTTFLLFSFFSVVPGFYFRSHYFITFIPSMALFVAILYHFARNISKGNSVSKGIFLLLFISSCVQLINKQRSYLFEESPKEVARRMYGINPFIESIPIAKYIQKNTKETDKIAILGSEPQIYYYANRVSATGYIYTYNLMEPHGYAVKMQEEMIAEIEKNDPAIILYVTVPTSWMLNENSKTKIFDWLQPYLRTNYTQTGIIEYKANGEVSIAWDAEVNDYGGVGNTAVLVYSRK